jgi:acyl-[acyl carrier protein]--UDP-N-acetylglucosamine O-acyltransferase
MLNDHKNQHYVTLSNRCGIGGMVEHGDFVLSGGLFYVHILCFVSTN